MHISAVPGRLSVFPLKLSAARREGCARNRTRTKKEEDLRRVCVYTVTVSANKLNVCTVCNVCMYVCMYVCISDMNGMTDILIIEKDQCVLL